MSKNEKLAIEFCKKSVLFVLDHNAIKFILIMNKLLLTLFFLYFS
jgi:hypothetical protein